MFGLHIVLRACADVDGELPAVEMVVKVVVEEVVVVKDVAELIAAPILPQHERNARPRRRQTRSVARSANESTRPSAPMRSTIALPTELPTR